eukprot:403372141
MEEDTFKDILSTLSSVINLSFLYILQQRIPWTVVYNVNLKVPDIILFKNGSPDSWFYSQKNEKVNRRDDNLLNLETVKNYFLKNAFDDNTVVILRQKAKDNSQAGDGKEYIVLDDDFVKNQFTNAVSQDLKASWEAAFTYLPFKQCGGIFKVTYEKKSDTKIAVHALKRNINIGKRGNNMEDGDSSINEQNPNVGSYTNKATRNDVNDLNPDSPKHQSSQKYHMTLNSGNKRSTMMSNNSSFRHSNSELKNDIANNNRFTNKGTLLTFKGREAGVQSTFNQQWKEIITRFVQIVELLQSLIFIQMWLIDAYNYNFEQKRSLAAERQKVKQRLRERDRKCACKSFCNYTIDVKNLIDDDDDLLQFNRDRDVFLGWINFAEQEINSQKQSGEKSNCFILPLKSILLEKHERLNYFKSIGRIKDDMMQGQKSKYDKVKSKEFDINLLDQAVNINDFDDPLLLHQRNYFTMSSLMGLDKYQHMRAASLYEQCKLCKNCFLALTKIEFHRRKYYQQEEQGKLPNQKSDSSYEDIEEDSLDLKYLPNKEVRKKKTKYVGIDAHNPHQVIKNRNLQYLQSQKEQTLLMRKNTEEFSVSKQKQPTNKNSINGGISNQKDKAGGYLSPSNNFMSRFNGAPSSHIGIDEEETNNQVLLPRIMKDIKTNKIFLTKKESEVMGLKYHLGHTGYLQKNPSEKIFLTKSSISLNKLADLASAAENIEFKLKTIKEDTINQNNLQNDWLKKVDVNFSALKKVTKKHKTRPTTMSTINPRKINIIESNPATLRLYDNFNQQSEQKSGLPIRINIQSHNENDRQNQNNYNQIDLPNFDEFKSTLDQKMLSFQRGENFGKSQLRITASTSDLPFEKRDQIMRKLNYSTKNGQQQPSMNQFSIAATPMSMMSKNGGNGYTGLALGGGGTYYGGFSGAINKPNGELAKSIPFKFQSQRQNYESSKFL